MTDKNLEFRKIMGSFTTGVAVVTTVENGKKVGLTVNSFTSVSLDPMLVLVSIAKHTQSHDSIRTAGMFAVSILGDSQELVSTVFAGAPSEERFRHVTTDISSAGLPVIRDCLAWMDVRVTNIIDGGDHSIIIGEVTAMRLVNTDAEPLLYFRGRYARLAQTHAQG